jgi:hypothetical protein
MKTQLIHLSYDIHKLQKRIYALYLFHSVPIAIQRIGVFYVNEEFKNNETCLGVLFRDFLCSYFTFINIQLIGGQEFLRRVQEIQKDLLQ